MAWTTPRTWVAGELVTAAIMNTHIRDNLLLLKTPITDLGLVQGNAANLTSIPAANLLIASQAQGDTLFASSTTVWARLPKSTTATRYIANTGTSNNPAWAQVDLSNGVTGTLPGTHFPDPLPARNGNALTSLDAANLLISAQAQGDMLYASSTTVWAKLGKSTLATRYLSNTGTSNNPAWAQVSLTTGVSGQLPDANIASGITASKLTGALPAIPGSALTSLSSSALSGALPALSGAALTLLNASALASGTVPDARFPLNLPAIGGASLTSLNASNLTTGTIPDARFPLTLPAASGANLTNLDAGDLATGTIPTARFPNPLPALSGANLTNLDAADLATGTIPDARLPNPLPAISGANLTSLNAGALASGTIPDARLPNPLPILSGTNLTTLRAAWPIGSVYIAVVSTNPATLLGFGTWTAFATGRTIVGFDTNQTEFDLVEETGGTKTHTLTTAEMPAHTHTQNAHNHTQDSHNHTQNAHNHQINLWQGGGVTANPGGGSSTTFWGVSSDVIISATATNIAATATNQPTTATNNNAGSGAAHNNLQPYIVVYMWKRTA